MFVLKNGTNPLHMPLDKGELGPGASCDLTDDEAHAFLSFPGFCIAVEAGLCALEEAKAAPVTKKSKGLKTSKDEEPKGDESKDADPKGEEQKSE